MLVGGFCLLFISHVFLTLNTWIFYLFKQLFIFFNKLCVCMIDFVLFVFAVLGMKHASKSSTTEPHPAQ
jgi:hypothetical protein